MNVVVGSMPSSTFVDFANCVKSVGTEPPRFNVNASSTLSYRCFGREVTYILWAIVTVNSNDPEKMESGTTRKELSRNTCGKDVNCICCPKH